jgi:hypothetical protein
MTDISIDPPQGWEDTKEQAAIRACISIALDGKDPIERAKVASDLITMLRDQILTDLAQVRISAVKEARTTMEPRDIVAASGMTQATVYRLLNGRHGG